MAAGARNPTDTAEFVLNYYYAEIRKVAERCAKEIFFLRGHDSCESQRILLREVLISRISLKYILFYIVAHTCQVFKICQVWAIRLVSFAANALRK